MRSAFIGATAAARVAGTIEATKASSISDPVAVSDKSFDLRTYVRTIRGSHVRQQGGAAAMVAKSERFEMRLDEDILARVDQWRAGEADLPSRSEAMRRLIEEGLARHGTDKVSFSDGEKLLLLAMRDVFKHLKIRNAETDLEFVAQSIYGGHTWAPKWQFSGVFHGHEDRPADLRIVLDILEMWDVVEYSFEQLNKKDRARVEEEGAPFGDPPRFRGFDGNSEARFIGIAGFLIDRLERFQRFAGRDLNAHMPTLAAGHRMLTAFAPMRERGFGAPSLTAAEIITVLQAAPDPTSLTARARRQK